MNCKFCLRNMRACGCVGEPCEDCGCRSCVCNSCNQCGEAPENCNCNESDSQYLREDLKAMNKHVSYVNCDRCGTAQLPNGDCANCNCLKAKQIPVVKPVQPQKMFTVEYHTGLVEAYAVQNEADWVRDQHPSTVLEHDCVNVIEVNGKHYVLGFEVKITTKAEKLALKKENLRAQALAKLTQEEREALGF